MKIIHTRVSGWNDIHLDGVEHKYIPLCGYHPKRKNGKPAGDGIGAVATKKGIKLLYQAFHETKPDFFVRWVHLNFGEEELAKLKKISPNTIFVVGEGNYPNEVSRYVKKLRRYTDVVLLNSHFGYLKKQYEQMGVRAFTLWDGFYPSDYLFRQKKTHDVLFAGSNHFDGDDWKYQNGMFRYYLVKGMSEQIDNMLILGPRNEWQGLRNVKANRTHYPYIKTMISSKIILGCNHIEIPRYYTRRTIQALASGSMLLTKYIPGMEKDFKNREHLVWFHKMADSVDLVRYYLENEGERNRIAENGQTLANERHTWQSRFYQLVKILKKVAK